MAGSFDLHAEDHALTKDVVESKLPLGLAPKLSTLIEGASLEKVNEKKLMVARKSRIK